MDALVDTNVFLWALFDEARLSLRAHRFVSNPDNTLVFSAVVGWEIVIKVQVGKLTLPDAPSRIVPHHVTRLGMRNLPIELRHALAVESLPMYHRDPFDRLLIAQSQSEGLPVVTADPLFKNYGVKTIW